MPTFAVSFFISSPRDIYIIKLTTATTTAMNFPPLLCAQHSLTSCSYSPFPTRQPYRLTARSKESTFTF